MMRLALPSLERFSAALRQPATLAERGVHAPFSSPVLFGARLRAGSNGAPEVVLTHPAGAKSWVVLPWAAALDACQPTLADRAFMQALGRMVPSPPLVREAAMRVAAAGLYGRAARSRGGAAGAAPGSRALAAALTEWRHRAPVEDDRRRATAIATQAAAVTLAAAAVTDPARRAALADGWDLLAALWAVGEEDERPALIRRLAAILPLISEDMLSWPGCEALAGLSPPVHPGAQGRFATPARCEAAIAHWLAHP